MDVYIVPDSGATEHKHLEAQNGFVAAEGCLCVLVTGVEGWNPSLTCKDATDTSTQDTHMEYSPLSGGWDSWRRQEGRRDADMVDRVRQAFQRSRRKPVRRHSRGLQTTA